MVGAATSLTISSVFLVAAKLLLPELSKTVFAATSRVIDPMLAPDGVSVTL